MLNQESQTGIKFQFQDGTIKRQVPVAGLHIVPTFEFQDGTIKSGKLSRYDLYQAEFHFQDGTIKRFSPLKASKF